MNKMKPFFDLQFQKGMKLGYKGLSKTQRKLEFADNHFQEIRDKLLTKYPKRKKLIIMGCFSGRKYLSGWLYCSSYRNKLWSFLKAKRFYDQAKKAVNYYVARLSYDSAMPGGGPTGPLHFLVRRYKNHKRLPWIIRDILQEIMNLPILRVTKGKNKSFKRTFPTSKPAYPNSKQTPTLRPKLRPSTKEASPATSKPSLRLDPTSNQTP